VEAASEPRALAGDKAQRIVDAMRRSVAQRGTAGSTFDHVAREAGVSRGLLHYYFGTKERLLVEVVRRDSDLRIEALDQRLAEARTADDFVQALVASLEHLVRNEPEFVSVVFELFTLSQRNADIATEFAALLRRTREKVGAVLADKQREGVLHLNASPDAVVDVLFSLGDGFAMRLRAEPDRDFGESIRAGVTAVRALLV